MAAKVSTQGHAFNAGTSAFCLMASGNSTAAPIKTRAEIIVAGEKYGTASRIKK
jgi:hypothetical protein